MSLEAAARLSRVPHSVLLAWGWRRALIAFASGAVSALAMAPFDAWPLLFATFPALVWLLDGVGGEGLRRARGAAAVGWWFGFGYLLAGLYWIGIAFLVDARTFGWLMPFAVVGLPAALALFTAAGTALAGALWTPGPLRILTLAAALTAAEWLRGALFTGFPWNAFGYALTAPLPLAQGAALVGLWGMTFLAVAVFASPAVLADERSDTPRPWLPPLLAALSLAVLAAYGGFRLAAHPTTFVPGVALRIMQPNLSQDEKFNYRAKAAIMARYLALSDRATGPEKRGIGDVTHLIWPESAFPFLLAREAEALRQIADFLPPGTVLLTGAARASDERASGGRLRVFNSIYAIGHDGSLLATYDKLHLVPFGEYLPFQSLLERLGLQQLTKQQGGFEAGDRRRLLAVPGAPPALPLICYEAIFPGEMMPRGSDRPGWLLNVTNDGWFGISTGPYQHLRQARLRAIEQGLPLVRAANTGVSAVVDSTGRIVKALPLGTEGVLDAPLPAAGEPTVFARFGDSPLAVLVGGLVLLAFRKRRRSGAAP